MQTAGKGLVAKRPRALAESLPGCREARRRSRGAGRVTGRRAGDCAQGSSKRGAPAPGLDGGIEHCFLLGGNTIVYVGTEEGASRRTPSGN